VGEFLRVVLCTCKGKIEREELEKLEKSFDVQVFDNLCEEKPEEFFDVVGCSYKLVGDLGKFQIDLNDLVFLRQDNATEKAELLLKAYRKMFEVEREVMRINVSSSFLVETDDVEFAKELQKIFTPLYVVTRNKEMKGVGIPIMGKVTGFEGELGSFRVFIDGVNMHTGEAVESVVVSQLLIPGMKLRKDGAFNVKSDVLDAISNVGEFAKFKAVEYDASRCAASFNEVSGCKLCECTHECLIRERYIRIEHRNCFGCGRCASLCPTDALEFSLMPGEVVEEIINTLSGYREEKVLLYVCKEALGKVYGGEKTGTFFPVVVPCVAALSEVDIIYPLLRGFNGVYVLHCSNCPHGSFDGLRLAESICEAFDIDNIVHSEEFDERQIEMLLKRSPVDTGFDLRGSNKREKLLEIVKRIEEKRELKVRKLSFPGFGEVNVSYACTLCETCHKVCPTGALKKEGGKLKFSHGLCIGCKLCEKLCPENAIAVKDELDLGEFCYEIIVREDDLLECPRCGKRHISKREYQKLSELTGQKYSLMFCRDCRAVVIFEGIYREIFGGEK